MKFIDSNQSNISLNKNIGLDSIMNVSFSIHLIILFICISVCSVIIYLILRERNKYMTDKIPDLIFENKNFVENNLTKSYVSASKLSNQIMIRNIDKESKKTINRLVTINLFINTINKLSILYLIFSKLYEIIYLDQELKVNYSIKAPIEVDIFEKNADYYSNLSQSILSYDLSFNGNFNEYNNLNLFVKYFLEITFMIGIYIINQSSFEFHDSNYKSIPIIIFFSFYSFYSIDLLSNKKVLLYNNYIVVIYVSFMIISLNIFSAVINNKQFISRLNKEGYIAKKDDKYLLDSFIEDMAEESKLCLEAANLYEKFTLWLSIKNVRINRSIIWRYGVFFTFLIGFCFLLFQCFYVVLYMKTLFMGLPFSINNESIRQIQKKGKTFSKDLQAYKNKNILNNFENSLFPNSIIFVIISNLDYKTLLMNENFIKFFEEEKKLNNFNRLYKIKTHSNEVSNWISYFSGMKPELTGLRGNSIDHIDGQINLDSIFSKIEEKNIKNKIYAGTNMSRFLKRFYPTANIHNFNGNSNEMLLDDKFSMKGGMINEITDETKFQELIREILNNEEITKNTEIRKDMAGSLNQIKKIYFSNNLSIIHFDGLIKYDFNIENEFNHEEYRQDLDGKIEYIKNIYSKINNNTLLLVTSDSSFIHTKNDEKPFLMMKKNSQNQEIEDLLDMTNVSQVENICPTISALMGLDIPMFNQGKFIDEIIQSDEYTKTNKDFHYLILRQQKQILNQEIIKIFKSYSDKSTKFDNKNRLINSNFIPPQFSSAEFYKSEIDNFDKIKIIFQKELYLQEFSKNKCLTFIFVILITILIFSTFTFLTFGDLTGILLFKSLRKIDYYALLYLVILKTIFFFSVLLFYLIINNNETKLNQNILNSSSKGYNYFISCLVIPFCLYVIYSKTIFCLFLYLDKVKTESGEELNFFFENLFKDIKSAVLKHKALAVIYLFRLYNLQITLILNAILFMFSNKNCFLFSKNSIKAFTLYFEEEGKMKTEQTYFSSILVDIQTILISYLFAQLIYYFNYPIYNNTRQIFDCIFNLYEEKVTKDARDKDALSNLVMDKKILESHFSTNFINFDKKSESFYISCNYEKIKDYNYLKEGAVLNLIYLNVVNEVYISSNFEKDYQMFNQIMGKDQKRFNEYFRDICNKI